MQTAHASYISPHRSDTLNLPTCHSLSSLSVAHKGWLVVWFYLCAPSSFWFLFPSCVQSEACTCAYAQQHTLSSLSPVVIVSGVKYNGYGITQRDCAISNELILDASLISRVWNGGGVKGLMMYLRKKNNMLYSGVGQRDDSMCLLLNAPQRRVVKSF